MASPDDPWETFDEKETEIDQLKVLSEGPADPVPEAVPTPVSDRTGKYQTLRQDQILQHERDIAQARIDQFKYDSAGLRLFLIATGANAESAERTVDFWHKWLARPENEALVREVLKG